MEEFLAFGIVGLTTAAIYAIIGSGLVLTYVTTGVFNFAQGAAGMLAAFAYWQFAVGWGWPVWAALVAVLLVLAPAFGLALERVVMRPIQGLGEIERVVVTVALLSGMIAVANLIWNPNVERSINPFLFSWTPFRIGPATITWQQAITMAVAVAVAVGLRILLFRTRTGTEMRATVDDRVLTGLTGGDPVRASRVAWILATQLAAVAGILIASQVALSSSQLALVIVSAYTAAIFGRLRSLPMTFAGAIVVGCMESYLTGYLPQNGYLPGLRLAASPLLLFIALLIFRQRRLPGRDRQLRQVPTPTIRGTLVFAAVVVAGGVVLGTVLSQSDLITYGAIFSLGLVALSYVPLSGFAGQISLCQLTMAGIGAVVWSHLGGSGNLLALVAAMLVPAAVGAVIAVPALRLSGVYVALATTAFAIVMDYWIFGLPPLRVFGLKIAFFDQGSVNAVGPSLFGWHLDSGTDLMVFGAVSLAVVSFGVAMLRRGRFGRRLIALRDSEAAYATLGGNLLAAKVAVFALAAGIAGLGGAAYAMQQGSVTADQFSYTVGLPIFLVAVIGGVGGVGAGLFTGWTYIGGTAAANAVLPWLQNLTPVLPGLTGVALGKNPTGIVPLMRREWAGFAADRLAIAACICGGVAAWVLRLTHVFNGWMFFGVSLVVLTAARLHSIQAGRRARSRASAEQEIPVEWWGVRRDWQAQDEEVLARAVAKG
jgi:branched-chain amino acid transport system permease protein